VTAHPAAVLRRAATLAPRVLPAHLAELAADEIGIELGQLDAGAPADSADERIMSLAQEILTMLPADYATRAQQEVEAAGWRPWSQQVAADLLHLVDTWDEQGPGAETRILLGQIRQLVYEERDSRDREAGDKAEQPASLSFQDELAEDIMIGYDDYLRDKGIAGGGQ